MSSELISREKLIEAINTEISNVPAPDTEPDYYVGVTQGLKLAVAVINNAPAVDLQHGGSMDNFCVNCGAKIIKGDDYGTH